MSANAVGSDSGERGGAGQVMLSTFMPTTVLHASERAAHQADPRLLHSVATEACNLAYRNHEAKAGRSTGTQGETCLHEHLNTAGKTGDKEDL